MVFIVSLILLVSVFCHELNVSYDRPLIEHRINAFGSEVVLHPYHMLGPLFKRRLVSEVEARRHRCAQRLRI